MNQAQNKKTNRPNRPYWYFITYEECVLCWRHRTYRERRYDARPKNQKIDTNFENLLVIHTLYRLEEKEVDPML